MEKKGLAVKRIRARVALGMTLSQAIHKEMQMTLSAFAEAHGFRQPEVSMCLCGYPGRTYPTIRDAVAVTLGVERKVVDGLIAEAAGPMPGGAVA